MNRKSTFLDKEIVQRFIEDDQAAFEEVYSAYQPHVFRIAYQFTSNRESANDIVQETFFKVYKSKGSLEHVEALFTWISQITYRLCVNNYHKSKKDANYYSNDIEDLCLEQHFEDQKQVLAIDRAQMEAAKEIIIKSLSHMNPEFKVTGYLRFFEELSVKEIAEVTSVPTGTVLSRLSRIKRGLRVDLEEHNFTKETCFSILLIPNMVVFYQAFVNTFPPSKTKNVSSKQVNNKRQLHSKKTIKLQFMVVIAAIALPITSIVFKKVLSPKNLLNKLPAEIININYNKELSNLPLKVLVETSNENYDDIKINEENQAEITKNGEHVITLWLDGEIIDQSTVLINNIDMDIPKISGEIITDEQIILTLEDQDSGIKYEDMELYGNGESYDAFVVDQEAGILTIENNLDVEFHLLVSDQAGNILNVKMNSYRKDN